MRFMEYGFYINVDIAQQDRSAASLVVADILLNDQFNIGFDLFY